MNRATLRSCTPIPRLVTSLILLVSIYTMAPAQADVYKRYYGPRLSDALEAKGFGTLKFALDTTELTSVLDSNRVTVFAPTDDVFEATAAALGCTNEAGDPDVLQLATQLLSIPVGDSNALTVVLTHHAVLGRISSKLGLLNASPIETVSEDEVTTGVNSEGLFVQGSANNAPSTITVDGIRGRRWVIYPIDSILLPFAPPDNLCS